MSTLALIINSTSILKIRDDLLSALLILIGGLMGVSNSKWVMMLTGSIYYSPFIK